MSLNLFPTVRSLRHFAALLLVAVWLPITQHCLLEAMGVLTHAEAAEGCCAAEANEGCVMDACKLLEEGDYRLTKSSIVVAPVWTDLIAFFCIQDFTTPVEAGADPEAIVSSYDRPRGCGITWQFERRAAQAPRAPSSMIA